MSRIITIVVILLLMAVVALVLRMGTEDAADSGPDLGDGYTYRGDTLERFRLLLEDPGWTLADPQRNAQGMLEAVHVKTGLTFVAVPAGSFLMGSTKVYGSEPVRRVTLQAFLLCRTECTQEAWVKGEGLNYSEFPGGGHPVEYVDWGDCRQWCARNLLRLPSESEWEYACRAGSTGLWFFGDREDQLSRYGWFSGNSGDTTHPVASKVPNPWGFFDIVGNVFEWCEDTWHEGYEGAPMDGSPWSIKGESSRVFRGGSHSFYTDACRSADRDWDIPGAELDDTGFRPAADFPEVK